MDARSPPSARPPTPWLSCSFRSSRSPPLSPLRYRLCNLHYALICSHMCKPGAGSALFGVVGRGCVAYAPWQEDRGRRSGLCAGPRGFDHGRDGCSSLVQVRVTWEGQELDELVVGRDTGEEFGGVTELVGFPAFGADDVGFDLLEFLVEGLVEEVFRHLGAVLEDASLVVDPLPDLGTADLRSRRVLHEVEDGDGAASCEPGRQVLHADGDVVAEAVHGDLALRLLQQILRGWTHVGDLVELVGLGHVLVEGLSGEPDHAGMGDPS